MRMIRWRACLYRGANLLNGQERLSAELLVAHLRTLDKEIETVTHIHRMEVGLWQQIGMCW